MSTPYKGLTALVTGASSGLGAEFAQQLAASGCHLLLTARRADRLENLAQQLRQAHGVQVDVMATDLGNRAGRDALYQALNGLNRPVDILINNAGFGVFGSFADADWSRLDHMLEIDIRALTELTHRLLPGMRAAQRGFVLNVSSIGAYQPTPTYAAYSAAKSYVLMFSEALRHELKQENIHVTALSPGITATEFLQVSGQRATLYQRLCMMQAPDVVRTGLRALAKNKADVVPGLINKLTVWSHRLSPRALQTTLAYLMMKN